MDRVWSKPCSLRTALTLQLHSRWMLLQSISGLVYELNIWLTSTSRCPFGSPVTSQGILLYFTLYCPSKLSLTYWKQLQIWAKTHFSCAPWTIALSSTVTQYASHLPSVVSVMHPYFCEAHVRWLTEPFFHSRNWGFLTLFSVLFSCFAAYE